MLYGIFSGGQRIGVIWSAKHFVFLAPPFTLVTTEETIIRLVIVPNVSLRLHEVKQFKNGPLEYVHLDLSFASMSSATMAGGLTAEGTMYHQAATDRFKNATTEVALKWVGSGCMHMDLILMRRIGGNKRTRISSPHCGRDTGCYSSGKLLISVDVLS